MFIMLSIVYRVPGMLGFYRYAIVQFRCLVSVQRSSSAHVIALYHCDTRRDGTRCSASRTEPHNPESARNCYSVISDVIQYVRVVRGWRISGSTYSYCCCTCSLVGCGWRRLATTTENMDGRAPCIVFRT